MLLAGRHDQKPNLDQLFGVAVGQAGYFTAAQAKEAGYSLQLLQHHLRNGSLERAGRGIFRFVRFPATDEADFLVLWALVTTAWRGEPRERATGSRSGRCPPSAGSPVAADGGRAAPSSGPAERCHHLRGHSPW